MFLCTPLVGRRGPTQNPQGPLRALCALGYALQTQGAPSLGLLVGDVWWFSCGFFSEWYRGFHVVFLWVVRWGGFHVHFLWVV